MRFHGASPTRGLIAGLAVAAGTGALGVTASADALLIRPAGRGSYARLAAALQQELQRQGGAPRVLELSRDAPADAARLSRETRDRPVLFAVGPDAADIAGRADGAAGVVSLGVPNPAHVKTPGTYISIYPRLEAVLQALAEDLGIRRAGLLFSPSQNREIGLAFIRAGQAAGVSIQPLPVGSDGDLIRRLRSGLEGLDVLLLPVDPILFDRRSLEYVVEETRKAGVPTVGFLEGLERLGVTLTVAADPAAVARVAVAASADPVTVGKKRMEVDGWKILVSPAGGAAVGLSSDAIDALRSR